MRPGDRAARRAWNEELDVLIAGLMEAGPGPLVDPLPRRLGRIRAAVPLSAAIDIDGVIGCLAEALGTCEDCLEPNGHTTDCLASPGRLKPHGTRAAVSRHGRRGEDPCGLCAPVRVAVYAELSRNHRPRRRDAGTKAAA
jgi:hypothetical protein